MARLAHPCVVPVYDVGATGDDVFVAMELVDGHSERDWLAKVPLADRLGNPRADADSIRPAVDVMYGGAVEGPRSA